MTRKKTDQLQEKALAQLKPDESVDESVFEKDGAFASILERFIEATRWAEMDGLLGDEG